MKGRRTSSKNNAINEQKSEGIVIPLKTTVIP